MTDPQNPKTCPCSDCVCRREKPADENIAKAHPYVRKNEEPLKK